MIKLKDEQLKLKKVSRNVYQIKMKVEIVSDKQTI